MILVKGALELCIADLLHVRFSVSHLFQCFYIMMYISLLTTEYKLIHLRVKLFFKSAFSGSDSVF